MCTLKFMKDVLAKKKLLMKVAEITGIPEIPRIPEINAELIWSDIKKEPQITAFFPDVYVTSIRVPDRTYMFSFSFLLFYLPLTFITLSLFFVFYKILRFSFLKILKFFYLFIKFFRHSDSSLIELFVN